jgi:hypothetical protein
MTLSDLDAARTASVTLEVHAVHLGPACAWELAIDGRTISGSDWEISEASSRLWNATGWIGIGGCGTIFVPHPQIGQAASLLLASASCCDLDYTVRLAPGTAEMLAWLDL